MSRSTLVTGGNRGIGLAIARRLAAAGDAVTVASRSGDKVDGLATVACDVRDVASVDEAFAKAEAEQGPVEVVVANAGITNDQLLARMSEDDFTAVLDTNLTGAYRVARRAVRPMMRMRRGRLIFISSVVGLLGSGGQANYAASKAGLVGLARSLARELSSRNITCNVVAPGFVDTDMTAVLPDERKAAILAQVPMGRPASAEEVDGLGAVLAGDTVGASVLLTGVGRLSWVERIARRLPDPPPVLELDVTDEGHLGSLAERASAHTDRLDGVVHGIAFAPQTALGGNFLNTPWADVATAVHVSAYSLKALAMAALPLMGEGGAIVGLDFDASVAWPAYDWMGVAKAGLESCARYLARDLGPRGIRVNLVAAGPLRTMAAKSIPGFADFEGLWPKRAPLGWQISDPERAARACVA